MPDAVAVEHALQEAIYQLLAGDIDLEDLLGTDRIYDQAPDRAELPYIVFGPIVSRDGATATEDGRILTLTLNIWSNLSEKSALLGIMERVRSLLHDHSAALSGYVLISLREEMADVSADRDSELYRATLRFRALTEPQ